MVEVSQEGESVVFNVKGLHKLWAFRSKLQIPANHIRGVRQDPEVTRGWWKGLKVPGTHVPGLITAGTFLKDERRIFWDVSNEEKAIIIDLEHEDYDQLIIEVEDPAAVIELLSAQ